MGQPIDKMLKKWRKSLGLVQKQAADILGVRLRTYQGWEGGKNGPDGLAMAELERRISEHKTAST